jgi:hypothetical protein
MEARREADGSIGIYGNTLLSSGNITAGSDKDRELLQKAQKNSEKDTHLFSIPRPVVLEKNKQKSNVKAYYTLQDKILKIHVSGLKAASFQSTQAYM